MWMWAGVEAMVAAVYDPWLLQKDLVRVVAVVVMMCDP